MPDPIRVFVGYDPDEALTFSVCSHSIHRQASVPVSIQPVMLSQLRGYFSRHRDPLQSTEFSFSRFLVPALCGYKGWAIFMDGDMILRADIAELWALRKEQFAVQVVMHDDSCAPHAPGTKFLGRTQTPYQRKNWSSVMLMNCAKCGALTRKYVDYASGLELHQFKWLWDSEIGSLPKEWNHLVGVNAPNPEAKLVHYTLGLPFFHGYNECEYAKEWRIERDLMMDYEGRLWGR